MTDLKNQIRAPTFHLESYSDFFDNLTEMEKNSRLVE
jgi:hypothetical protein